MNNLISIGFEARNEDNRRRKFTFHSFRRFVKSTISDLGYQHYSEWFIGHSGSTYYRKTEAEKLEIFKKVEPYLTYLDYSTLEAQGVDTQTQLQDKDKRINYLENQIQDLNTKFDRLATMFSEVAAVEGARQKNLGKFTNKHDYVDYHKNDFIRAVQKGRPRILSFETMPDEPLSESKADHQTEMNKA
jgi:hypothetical protein